MPYGTTCRAPVPEVTQARWCQQRVSTCIAWIAAGAMRCTVPSAPVIEMLRPARCGTRRWPGMAAPPTRRSGTYSPGRCARRQARRCHRQPPSCSARRAPGCRCPARGPLPTRASAAVPGGRRWRVCRRRPPRSSAGRRCWAGWVPRLLPVLGRAASCCWACPELARRPSPPRLSTATPPGLSPLPGTGLPAGIAPGRWPTPWPATRRPGADADLAAISDAIRARNLLLVVDDAQLLLDGRGAWRGELGRLIAALSAPGSRSRLVLVADRVLPGCRPA